MNRRRCGRILAAGCVCVALAVPASALAQATPATPEVAPRTDSARIVAYVTAGTAAASLDPARLTHLNFAFAHIDAGGRASLRQPEDSGSLERLTALKARNPALKILLSIGGWGADGFSDAALTDASRRAFAASVAALLAAHALDGVDLDWEYPGQGAANIRYRREDGRNFTLLLRELRRQLDAAAAAQGRRGANRYLISAATAGGEYLRHTQMRRSAHYLDWVNLMGYDFFNSLTPLTGHHAGLYRSGAEHGTVRTADLEVRQSLAAGIPAAKIVLGVAFFGHAFAGVRALDDGVGQPYQHYAGGHSYRELTERFIGRAGYVSHWDEAAQAPYLWNAATHTFITYEDPRSLAVKLRYVRQRRLGGLMCWELGEDRDGELLRAMAGSPAAAQAPP